MNNENANIRIKRGNKSDMPILDHGEMGWCDDSEELYIGGVENENVKLFENPYKHGLEVRYKKYVGNECSVIGDVMYGDITDAGKVLLDKIANNNGVMSLKITKVVIGDGEGISYTLALGNVELDKTRGKVSFDGKLELSSIKQGFFWRECGLYAMDPDKGEILYNYAYSTKPDYIAASDSGMMEEILVSMIATVGSNTNVDVTIDDSMVFATKKVVDKKPYYYSCIADMKADTSLKIGDMAITNGYASEDDGGYGEYSIVSDESIVDDGSVHLLNNGLKAKLIIKNNSVNISQFGVLPTGIIDNLEDRLNISKINTDKINKTIDFAFKSKVNTVCFPSGLFYIFSENKTSYTPVIGGIRLKSNLKFLLDKETKLHSVSNNNPYYSIFSGLNCENITIDSGILVGNRSEITASGEQGHGISLNSCNNVTINNVKIYDFYGDGICCSATFNGDWEVIGNAIDNKEITIENCLISNCRRQGISIVSVIGCKIKNNTIEKINGVDPSSGIDIEANPNTSGEYVEKTMNIEIVNNTFKDIEKESVLCVTGKNVNITNNTFFDSTTSNSASIINLYKNTNVRNIIISGNTFINTSSLQNLRTGVTLSYPHQSISVVNNNFLDIKKAIATWEGGMCDISSNIIKSVISDSVGIHCAGVAAIRNNIIEVKGTGVLMYNGNNNKSIVEKNSIIGSQRGIAFDTGSLNTKVTYNNIINCLVAISLKWVVRSEIIGNTITDNLSDLTFEGLKISDASGGNLVLHNSFNSRSLLEYGIYISNNSAENKICFNYLLGCTKVTTNEIKSLNESTFDSNNIKTGL